VKGCELPIYSRFITPLAGTAAKLGELQISVTCGRVSVNPGDLILADNEGIVVVDPRRSETLLVQATTIKDAEHDFVQRLNTGHTLSDGLNLDEHVDALLRGEPSSLRFLT
jgi:regulator of RNase E activity RraA